MRKTDYHLFNIAKELSLMSDFDGAHVGAVVVEGKTIISSGFNTQKTNPLQHKYNKYRNFNNYSTSIAKTHAEVSALSKIVNKSNINWNNVTLYTYRQLKDGKPACSRPCVACMNLLKDLGIKKICYIDELGDYTVENKI